MTGEAFRAHLDPCPILRYNDRKEIDTRFRPHDALLRRSSAHRRPPAAGDALCSEPQGGVWHCHDRRCKTALHAREDIAAFVAQYMKEGIPHEHCI